MERVVEVLREEVRRLARREAERIVEEARRRAEEIIREAERRAEELVKTRMEEARREARRRLGVELHKARMEGIIKLQRLKSELLKRVFDEALARLRELAEGRREEYSRVLADWISEAARSLGGGDLVVYVNRRDWSLAATLLPSIEERLRREGLEVRLRLSDEAIDVAAGALVATSDGRLMYNSTLEARLERVRNKLSGEVYKLLFGGGEG